MLSLREFRSYEGSYLDLGHRLQYGVSAFDNTQFFYASPYALQTTFFREGAFATERVTGGLLLAQYPLDKFRRLELNTGIVRVRQGFENQAAQLDAEAAAAAQGTQFFLNNGTIAPISLSLVGETTRFREFGPLTGSTYRLGLSYAPGVNGLLSRHTVDVDVRKYLHAGSARARRALPRLPVGGAGARHLLLRREHGAAGLPVPLLRRQRGVLREPGAAPPDHRSHEDADRDPRTGARHAVRRDRRGQDPRGQHAVRHQRSGHVLCA